MATRLGEDQAIAEVSIDLVSFGDDATVPAYELEVELLPGGRVADLEPVIAELIERWAVLPEIDFQVRAGPGSVLPGADIGAGRAQDPDEEPGMIEHINSGSNGSTEAATEPVTSEPQGNKKTPVGAVRAGVVANEPMAEAVRKILRSQFQVMVDSEAGSRKGKNIDAVHDMRVATRRMRRRFSAVWVLFPTRGHCRFPEGSTQNRPGSGCSTRPGRF